MRVAAAHVWSVHAWVILILRVSQGDVVLPSHSSGSRASHLAESEEPEDLRPKLASADVDARVIGLNAFLENPARALQSAQPSRLPSRRSARLSISGNMK